MNGFPLNEYDYGYQNITCSTSEIMDQMGNVVGETWMPLISMKEELINHMKDSTINMDVSFPKLDELSTSIITFMKEFNTYKKSMDAAEEQMKQTIETNKKDIKIIETFIEFLNNISNQTNKDISSIQSQINNICDDIKNTSRIKECKEIYIEEKIKFNKYLNIIKLLNQMNVGSTCSMCLQDNVDSYFNPCGHTACSTCIKKNEAYNSVYNRSSCPLCRKEVITTHKLFFT
jgi:hypothetical protein